MSYILDALKKSDQERKQGDVPNLQTVHVAVVPEQKNAWPMYALILFLLMSLAFLIGVLISDKNEPDLMSGDKQIQYPVTPVLDEINEKKVIVEEKNKITEEPEIVVKETVAEIAPVLTREDKSQKMQKSQISEVVYLHELPDYQQQLIPEITFAGHMYSSAAINRSVIINGRAMSEGESLMEGLVLEEITSNGVVFSFNDLLFRVDVLQDWSFE